MLCIVGEAVANASRRAGPSAVTVAYEDEALRIIIDDDGPGFDLPSNESVRQGHFGL